ncbi:MAG: hypothetical protein ACRC2T_16970, partial [Thermoguttaceae bacterium]
MNEWIVFTLLRTSIAIAVAAVVIIVLLKYCSCYSPYIHRIAWALVILQGILWMQLPLNIPVLLPEEQITQTTAVQTVIPQEVYEETITDFESSELILPDIEPHDAELPLGVTSSFETLSPAPPSKIRISPVNSFISVWVAGLLVVLSLRCFGLILLWCHLKSAKTADDNSQKSLNLLGGKKFRLCFTDNFGPAIFYRTILIPESLWEDSSEPIRQGILKHELS